MNVNIYAGASSFQEDLSRMNQKQIKLCKGWPESNLPHRIKSVGRI
jgi:hypothetical protein